MSEDELARYLADPERQRLHRERISALARKMLGDPRVRVDLVPLRKTTPSRQEVVSHD